MTYNQASEITRIALAIPIAIDGRKLPQDTAASVIMAQVGWSAVMDGYESRMQEALKKMKKEGFDERYAANERMKETDRRKKALDEWNGEGEQPAAPTGEELEAAEKTRETAEEFEKELAEVLDLYSEARTKEGEKTVTGAPSALTRKELADIIGMLGTEGTVSVALGVGEDGRPIKGEIARHEFIRLVAANLVE